MRPHSSFVKSFSAAELRGIAQLATQATVGVSHIVESMHHTIAKPWALFSKQSPRKLGGVPGAVYASVRGSARVLGGGAALALKAIESQSTEKSKDNNVKKRALISALNGIVGDHLAATKNPLAIPMQWRIGDGFAAQTKLIVLIHGLCMSDQQWLRNGHDHGAYLAQALGATPIYLCYNSGLPIADNGAQLSNLLDDVVAQWSRPVRELHIVAHSMGGLVARAACAQENRAWQTRLKTLTFLGTPHLGAPLERGGHWIDLLLGAIPYSAPFARLTTLRSAGITDLREGNRSDAPPTRVKCFAVAGSLSDAPNAVKDATLGDGLVTVDSALGSEFFALRKTQTFIARGVGHLDLLSDLEVAKQLHAWLSSKKKQ